MQIKEWQWSEDDPTTLRVSDVSDISIDQYGSLLAPFENGFHITDEEEPRSSDEPRSSSAPPGRSRDASPRSSGAGLAQLAYARLGVRLSPTTRSISDPPLPGGEIAGGAFDDMEEELARLQRGEDQKNSAEGGPTEDELAWLDMQCDALDRAAAEDAWVAQQTRTYPELHADEARWLFNACPPSPLLQRRACPPEVPEERPCSMDEY